MHEPADHGRNNDVIALAGVFTDVGRDLLTRRTIDEVLYLISHRAYELIPSAEHAAISRGRRGSFETMASTSELPPLVDKIQYELGTGPCVDAVLDECVYRASHLAHSERWPEFGRLAADRYGINSMLSVRIFLEGDDLIAGLNLYASAENAFDASDETTATLLATHGALALTAARRQVKIDNLEKALRTNRRIGVALGILMTSHKITDVQAFDLLRIASQNRHVKLHDIAEEVVETGALELPAAPQRRFRDQPS